MPPTELEMVFTCDNPKTYPNFLDGICKGMVMMFIQAVAGMVDDRDWMVDLHNGAVLDPRRANFYMNAHAMQLASQTQARALRRRIPDTDLNERSMVPAMYGQCDLVATELSNGYVNPRGGVALAEGARDAVASWFHVSLRSAGGGHSIAIWRSSPQVYLLFDPNFGAVQFVSYERFRFILEEQFARERDDEGDGPYADYSRVCWWGIDVFVLEPPPLPPPFPR